MTVTLSTPNGALPVLLDIPIALGDGDRPLGTGPYVLTEEATGGDRPHCPLRLVAGQVPPIPDHPFSLGGAGGRPDLLL